MEMEYSDLVSRLEVLSEEVIPIYLACGFIALTGI